MKIIVWDTLDNHPLSSGWYAVIRLEKYDFYVDTFYSDGGNLVPRNVIFVSPVSFDKEEDAYQWGKDNDPNLRFA